MIRESLAKITIGTAGGALIEGIDQAAQVAAPVVADATGSADPIELVKLITQLVVALATVISLFVKPKPKHRPADPAPQPIQPMQPLHVSEDQPADNDSGNVCTYDHCPWPEDCRSRCIYPKGTDERLRAFKKI